MNLSQILITNSKLRLAYQHVEQRKKNGQSYENAANATAIELVQCAESHCRAFLVSSAYEMTKNIDKKLSKELSAVIHQLVELYAIDTCLKSLGDLIRVCILNEVSSKIKTFSHLFSFVYLPQFTTIKESDIQQLQQKLEICLAKIRPNAVGIVDGFDIPDQILCSALGAYDGNVYERLFAEAQKSPLNKEPVNKSFHLYLKPFMKSNL